MLKQTKKVHESETEKVLLKGVILSKRFEEFLTLSLSPPSPSLKKTQSTTAMLSKTNAFQNRDGRLTKAEFREGSKCDPYIVQALSAGIGGSNETT